MTSKNILPVLIKTFAFSTMLISLLVSCSPNEKRLPELSDRTIDCRETFDHLVQKIDSNYIGLRYMDSFEIEEYEQHKAEYQKKLKNLQGSDCTELLTEFIDWFNDGHLFVLERPDYSESEKESIYNFTSTFQKTDDELKEIMQSVSSDPIEGSWTDGNYLFYIVKEGGTLNAYTLTASDSLKKGTLVLRLVNQENKYSGTYFGYTNRPRYVTAKSYRNGDYLSIFGGIKWNRVDDDLEKLIERSDAIKDPKAARIYSLNDETVIFEIPSFSVDYVLFRDEILNNEQLLRDAKTLIIDVRGNTGGNAIYGMFTPLYQDKDLSENQGKVLACNDNLDYFEQLAARTPDVYSSVVERIEGSLGSLVDGPMYPRRPYVPEESNIEHVAILSDGACASACESFLLTSKLISNRVSHFAKEPTYGMIDYTSVNMVSLNSGNQNIYFGYPTGKLSDSWYLPGYEDGYNESGILPDIQIDRNVGDQIAFIVKYLSRQENQVNLD